MGFILLLIHSLSKYLLSTCHSTSTPTLDFGYKNESVMVSLLMELNVWRGDRHKQFEYSLTISWHLLCSPPCATKFSQQSCNAHLYFAQKRMEA